MRKSLEIMMVFGLIFIVISSPIPLPSDVDEEGNGTSELDDNTSILRFQFLEEPIQGGNIQGGNIQGGNIEEPSVDETMRDADMADEFSLDREQIYPGFQLDAAYNFQRDQLIFN